jgi:phosphoribosylformylglycinamidine (FGAM) synthase-like amidotransferase family enzyme
MLLSNSLSKIAQKLSICVSTGNTVVSDRDTINKQSVNRQIVRKRYKQQNMGRVNRYLWNGSNKIISSLKSTKLKMWLDCENKSSNVEFI